MLVDWWEGAAKLGKVCLIPLSPCGTSSRGAKLCTYLRWFARPDRVNTEPYYELPLTAQIQFPVSDGCSFFAG